MKLHIRHRTRGFTLIELMVTVTVLAVLLSLVAPSFKTLLTAQRMRSAAYDMVADLVLARSEALKRGEDVVVAPNASGWAGGWTVKVNSSAELVGQRNSVGTGVIFTLSPASITFDRNGRVSSSTAVVRFGLSDGEARKRCISLDPAGRPKNAAMECP